jgi:hypothetical protein
LKVRGRFRAYPIKERRLAVKKTVLLFTSMTFALLVGSAMVALLVAPRAQAEPRILYPNLKTVKPFDLEFGTETIDGQTHQLLRFSNTVYNAGAGPMELRGETITTPDGQEKTRVYQRLYDTRGKRHTAGAVGTFVYHPQHDHFHFGDFAEYQLWTRSEYNAWLRSDRTEGSPKRANRLSSKVTFCIQDYEKVDLKLSSPQYPVYDLCDPHLQGISVGWGDTYGYYLYDQWVDLGTAPLADGRYVLRSVADPENRLYESRGKTDGARESRKANAAVTYFTVEGGTIAVTGQEEV